MTTTGTDIGTIERITTAEEAERIGLAAYRALLADLRALSPDDWNAPTVCSPWTVADMVRHVLGAAEANTSIAEMARQHLHGLRHKSAFDGNPLDATNDLQVADHLSLGPAELLAELEDVYPASVRSRAHKPRFLDRIRLPVGSGGSTAVGMPSHISVGNLLKVIYTRDVWLHRVDIARAVGRKPAMDPDTDRRIVADVVREWADRHGEPFDLHLTGPAGGRYVRSGPGPSMELEAVEFCWILSGRGMPESGSAGEHLLIQRIAF